MARFLSLHPPILEIDEYGPLFFLLREGGGGGGAAGYRVRGELTLVAGGKEKGEEGDFFKKIGAAVLLQRKKREGKHKEERDPLIPYVRV